MFWLQAAVPLTISCLCLGGLQRNSPVQNEEGEIDDATKPGRQHDRYWISLGYYQLELKK